MAKRFVVNSSPLILLARSKYLHLLRVLSEKVVVPVTVLEEMRAGAHLDDAAQVVESSEWMQIAPDLPVPAVIQAWDLGGGESQVMAYALASKDCEAVLDDLVGRRCASSLGIKVVGTIDIVLAAKRNSCLQHARPVLESLRAHGMFVTDELMDAALREVGE